MKPLTEKDFENFAKVLVCGTRGKSADRSTIFLTLSGEFQDGPIQIIHGGCPNSADVLAAEWAQSKGVPSHEFPGTPGSYLSRNEQMVKECDRVIAFWDGYSYGTAQTIAHAVARRKPVRVIFV